MVCQVCPSSLFEAARAGSPYGCLGRCSAPGIRAAHFLGLVIVEHKLRLDWPLKFRAIKVLEVIEKTIAALTLSVIMH